MKYGIEDEKRIRHLLNVFGEYIRRNRHFDILYSEKAGYIRIVGLETGEGSFRRIASADKLLEMLLQEITYDAMTSEAYSGMGGSSNDPVERANRILRDCVHAEEAEIERLSSALAFLLTPMCNPGSGKGKTPSDRT